MSETLPSSSAAAGPGAVPGTAVPAGEPAPAAPATPPASREGEPGGFEPPQPGLPPGPAGPTVTPRSG